MRQCDEYESFGLKNLRLIDVELVSADVGIGPEDEERATFTFISRLQIPPASVLGGALLLVTRLYWPVQLFSRFRFKDVHNDTPIGG